MSPGAISHLLVAADIGEFLHSLGHKSPSERLASLSDLCPR